MRGLVLLGFLAACGPAQKPRDQRVTDRNVMVTVSGNAGAIEKLLADAVVDGGLWFPDATCAQFSGGGKIERDRFHEFARCLATLHWVASPRRDELADAVVLSYPPGFEIEARVVSELSGPHLLWIGYVARRDWDDNLPTITPPTLEALRVAGTSDGPVAPERAKELEAITVIRAAYTWFKVCIDATGAVTSAEQRQTTSLEAASAFAEAIAKWRFKPFTIGEHVLPVCSMIRLMTPRGTAPREKIPLPAPPSRSKKRPIVFAEGASFVEAQRIKGNRVIQPDDGVKLEMSRRSIARVVGSFRICLDETGHIESVLPFHSTGFADYDRELLAGIQSWVYTPLLVDGVPTPVCTAVSFIYTQYERGMSRLR